MPPIATIVQSRAGALLIGNNPLFGNRRRQLAALAMRHGLPAISYIREFVVAGGLMSYGTSDSDAYRRADSHYLAAHMKLLCRRRCNLPLLMSIVRQRYLRDMERPSRLDDDLIHRQMRRLPK